MVFWHQYFHAAENAFPEQRRDVEDEETFQNSSTQIHFAVRKQTNAGETFEGGRIRVGHSGRVIEEEIAKFKNENGSKARI